MIGRPMTAMIPEELQPEYEEKVARLARGETVEHFETRRRRKDGSLVDVSLALTAVRDADGAAARRSRRSAATSPSASASRPSCSSSPTTTR